MQQSGGVQSGGGVGWGGPAHTQLLLWAPAWRVPGGREGRWEPSGWCGPKVTATPHRVGLTLSTSESRERDEIHGTTAMPQRVTEWSSRGTPQGARRLAQELLAPRVPKRIR